MKQISAVLILLLSHSICALTVTSLNVEWYGRGGTIYGSLKDEYRDSYLKDFLMNQIPKTDVFVFQEILNTQRLSTILPEYKCSTYEINSGGHQHVSICVKKEEEAEFMVAEEVKVGRANLRPAFGAKLSNGVSVIGVHLKAGREETDLRLEQVQNLVTSPIVSLKQAPEAIVIGDFNTYTIDRTMRQRDDVELMDEIFLTGAFERTAHETPTYLGYGRRIFDRVWSRGVKVKRVEVFGPCKDDSVQFPFSRRGYFERFVSDHCALQIEIL